MARNSESLIYGFAPPGRLCLEPVLLHAVGANLRIVRKRQYYDDNNELVESILHQNIAEICMPHAIQIRQTGGPEVLNWTPIRRLARELKQPD
jgi:hypothetical protein